MLDMSAQIFASGPALSVDPKGLYAVLKALEFLSLRCCGPGLRKHTSKLADGLCAAFADPAASQELHTTMGNPLTVQARTRADVGRGGRGRKGGAVGGTGTESGLRVSRE